jgi:sorbitol-specific phosphotransferase system component IIBC
MTVRLGVPAIMAARQADPAATVVARVFSGYPEKVVGL